VLAHHRQAVAHQRHSRGLRQPIALLPDCSLDPQLQTGNSAEC
jgi:hypothetical protein